MDGNGLIWAYIIDGKGGASKIELEGLDKETHKESILWLHFDYTSDQAIDWITNKSGLDDVAASALLTEETRPRASLIGDGVLISLRGVNLSPGSEPEDMVAMRLWVDDKRIISTRKRKLLSEQDIVNSFEEKDGPKTTGEFVVDLADRLISRMEGTIEDIEDRVDQMEDEVISSESHSLRSKLSGVRREAIMLKRYLSPQREAMIKLQTEKISWLNENDNLRLRETTDRLIRYTEDLDSIRDRAAVTQEELVNRLSEQMNTRMYVLSLVAAIFLPLGFLTGLLGINVGGIPGAENKSAFLIFILILVIVVILQVVIFKRQKWL